MNLDKHPRLHYLSAANSNAQDANVGDFRTFIRRAIAKDEAAIEVGPSFSPIIAKADGYQTCVVDHTSRGELVEKYKNDVPDTSRIEEVDIIWRGEDLRQLLPVRQFRAIVGSHMIEHAPDFLGFINQCSDLLTTIGKIYLCVPDRRYCFDAFHYSTQTGKIIEDHRLARTRHTFQSFFNVGSQVRTAETIAWSQDPVSHLDFISGMPGNWLNQVNYFTDSETYVDNHENYFTPSSFALLLEELRHLGQTDLCISTITRARGPEFLVVLSRSIGEPRLEPILSDVEFAKLRMALRLNMMREEEEQIRLMEPVFQRYGI